MPANILRPLVASVVLLALVLFSGCKPKPAAPPTTSATPPPVVAPNKDSATRSADEIALLEASINGDTAQVKALLEKGVSPNTKDSEGRTPLTEAAYRGATEIVRMLIDHGADLFAKKNDGETAITMAAGHPDIANLIKLNLELLEMAGKGDVKGVQERLDKGASVNIRDPEGRTPLTESVWAGHVQVVKLLLERGANPNLRKNDGAAPLSIATGRGNKEIVEMLKKAGGK
jgi:ankyrin repeat protein